MGPASLACPSNHPCLFPLALFYTEEANVLNLKKHISDYTDYLGVSPEKIIPVPDKLWEAIDLRLRTANSKEYETREQA